MRELKIISIILEQQAGFTEFPCFLCLWDDKDCIKRYKQTEWQNKNALNRGSRNVFRELNQYRTVKNSSTSIAYKSKPNVTIHKSFGQTRAMFHTFT